MKRGYVLLALGVLLGVGLVAALASLLGLDRAQQLAEVAHKLTLATAAVVGGYWVYDRFVRERVGESRLDLTVSGEAIAGEPGMAYVAVTVGAENVGQEKVDHDHDYCALTVSLHEPPEKETEDGDADEASWRPLDRVWFVLQEQDAIEPGASFGDQRLLRLTPADREPVAVRLDLVVQSEDGGYWTATNVTTL